MVRHKNRWLLVKVELADEIRNGGPSKSSNSSFPSKKEFTNRLRKTISWCFGIAGEVPACDTQVRFIDAQTQLVVIRTPRDYCGKIRAALTLLLTRKQLASIGELSQEETCEYLAAVVSVHGSARTAKIAVFRKLREVYKAKIEESRRLFPDDDDDKASKKLCKALQERLALIQNTLN